MPAVLTARDQTNTCSSPASKISPEPGGILMSVGWGGASNCLVSRGCTGLFILCSLSRGFLEERRPLRLPLLQFVWRSYLRHHATAPLALKIAPSSEPDVEAIGKLIRRRFINRARRVQAVRHCYRRAGWRACVRTAPTVFAALLRACPYQFLVSTECFYVADQNF
jgi:hypothetical protein